MTSTSLFSQQLYLVRDLSITLTLYTNITVFYIITHITSLHTQCLNDVTMVVWIFKDLAGDQQSHSSSQDGLVKLRNKHYFKSHSSHDIISQQNNCNAVIPLVLNVIITNTRNCRATQTAHYRNAQSATLFLCFGVIHHSCQTLTLLV